MWNFIILFHKKNIYNNNNNWWVEETNKRLYVLNTIHIAMIICVEQTRRNTIIWDRPFKDDYCKCHTITFFDAWKGSRRILYVLCLLILIVIVRDRNRQRCEISLPFLCTFYFNYSGGQAEGSKVRDNAYLNLYDKQFV